MIIYGGILRSKGLGLQDNHRCGDWPRDLLVVVPVEGKWIFWYDWDWNWDWRKIENCNNCDKLGSAEKSMFGCPKNPRIVVIDCLKRPLKVWKRWKIMAGLCQKNEETLEEREV